MTARRYECAMRRPPKIALLFLSAIMVAMFARGLVEAKKKKPAPCAKGHKLTVVDLLMSPDPIGGNVPVRFWRAQVQVDGKGECETIIALKENAANRVVGPEASRVLKPGLNSVRFEPSAPYHFQRSSHCFSVSAGSGQAKQTLKGERRFCAHKTKNNRWTLRPHEDWRKQG